MKDLLGKHIKVNIYGTMYDGIVTDGPLHIVSGYLYRVLRTLMVSHVEMWVLSD